MSTFSPGNRQSIVRIKACQLIFAWYLKSRLLERYLLLDSGRERRAGEGMRKKRTWLNQVRLETELKNVVDSSRRLYKFQTEISGHAVCEWLTLTAGTHHPHQQMSWTIRLRNKNWNFFLCSCYDDFEHKPRTVLMAATKQLIFARLLRK